MSNPHIYGHDAVRSVQGPGAGREPVVEPARAGGQSVGAGEQPPRVRRAGAPQQAAAVLCLDRQRQPAPSRHGDAQAACRHRSDPRAVSRRRAGRDRRWSPARLRAMFGGGSLVPTVHAGKVRGLASTGKVRNPATPELPTIDEIYPGYEALIWHGLFVPAGTPQPIIDRLRDEIDGSPGAARVQEAAGRHRLRRALHHPRPRSSPPASRATTRNTAS